METYKLSDLLELKYGKDHKKLRNGSYPCYGSGGIIRYVDEYLYDKESILIPRKGSLNNLFYVNKPFWTVDTIFWSKINSERVDGKYLYYLLHNYDLAVLNEGTAIPSLTTKVLNQLNIKITSLSKQRKIAQILSMFDEKIKLNNEINNNLENLATIIYNKNFIDDGHEKKSPLKNYANRIVTGKTPSTKNEDYYGKEIPFITIPDMHNTVYITETQRYLSVYGANTQKTKFLPENTICVSCIGTAGLVSLTSKKSQTNQQINSIIPKDSSLIYYLYFSLKELAIDIINFGSGGSTICNLNKTQFENLEIREPNKIRLSNFNKLMLPIFKNILKNQLENKSLSELKQLLLPKLLSGELDVTKLK
ncbi:hypothetical protein IX317_000255 [Fusobacterium sp. DD29]|uniref:restriction endonuclease subunit S n=1 Tax=unclassified Fusobacterium TaxID=2648384 RepID=UPI001B8D374C|nr:MULTISPECIES: restriction endonuclease subunit S [unclassified Fusobacterium]MBR8748596.1 hypothetical protein [Fusobacterium sp. DD29]MBR8760863.1 hypothetical protein [Fusobacterium sp. DD25]MBR8766875.1 hypothetical protein [Fusobacterium sp. DD43]MBR8770876.1 hypothetical protein [Fusobacterium sp. DD40]MBR8775110.1 hypothetical protein [Fusobacterium sp. DD17]